MKIYEPIAIALVTVLVLASVFMLGKHSGYKEAIASRNVELGITNEVRESGRIRSNRLNVLNAITPR
jgi:hypothetical protein